MSWHRSAVASIPLLLFTVVPGGAVEVGAEIGNSIIVIGTPGNPGFSVQILKPGDQDNIVWTSGPNTTDQTIHDLQTAQESKFGRDQNGAPVGRTFNKFPVNGGPDEDGPGKWGSTTQTNGGGASLVNNGNKRILAVVSATGVLGEPPQEGDKQVQADYSAIASFSDPNFIYRDDLLASGIGAGTYGVYQILGITSLSMPLGVDTTLGSPMADMSISINTNLFAGDILNLSFESLGSAAYSSSSSAEFYQLDDLAGGPSFNPARQRTPEQISQTLADDLFADGFLDTPLYLGAYLPAALSFDPAGASPTLGSTGVSGMASEPATKIGYVPLPAGLPMLAAGLFGLALLRAPWRRH